MSAFAAIFRRDRVPASESGLPGMEQALSHRGADGRTRIVEGPLAAVHLHAWVTPEERGERQPLIADGRVLLFDGRLDNRDELAAALPSRPGRGRAPTDAELVLAAYGAWGEDFCGRLIGPFALALFDLPAGTALLARDPLGDRTLFFATVGSQLLIASEEAALVEHPEVSASLDEARLAHYFALEVPGDGSTFFSAVRELAPGKRTRVDASSVSTDSFWSPPAEPLPIRRADDLEEEYRELLARAVACRLRSDGPPAVLMSGGLDSTSVAALGAEALEGGQRRLRSVSWVFSDRRLDERAFMRPVVDRWKLDALEVDGDGLGPSLAAEAISANPNSPEENPYRLLKIAAYEASARGGSTALLSGGSADALYTGFERWLAELWNQGQRTRAMGEMALELIRFGPRTALRRAGVRRRRPLVRSSQDGFAPPWMTHEAGRLLTGPDPDDAWSPRAVAVAGPRPARSISLEVGHAARGGVDLRHPYRDLRLVEFMLRLPAHQLYRHGRFKAIARNAMAGRLPELVLRRAEPTSLSPLFEAAIRGRERRACSRLLAASDAVWHRYVRRDWVEAALRRSPGSAGDVALWNCLSFERWRRRFSRG